MSSCCFGGVMEPVVRSCGAGEDGGHIAFFASAKMQKSTLAYIVYILLVAPINIPLLYRVM